MRPRAFISLLAGFVLLGVAACGGSASRTSLAADALTSSSTTTTVQTASTTTAARARTVTRTSAATASKKPAESDSRKAPAAKTVAASKTTSTASSPSAHTILVERLRKSAAHRVTHQAPSSPLAAASGSQSARVLACLRHGGTGHVSADATGLWTGFESKTGTWVYVYLYPTAAAAAARARFLRAEEVATARRFLIQQPIAPYRGSPVPSVTVCLGGKAPKPPAQKPGSFTF